MKKSALTEHDVEMYRKKAREQAQTIREPVHDSHRQRDWRARLTEE